MKMSVVLASNTGPGIFYAIKDHARDLLKATNIDEFQGNRAAALER